MIVMQNRHPWYYANKYLSHLIIIRLLDQDTDDKKLHALAISNHDKLNIVKILKLHRNKYAIMFSTEGQKHIFYYKMNRDKQPLLSKKISLQI